MILTPQILAFGEELGGQSIFAASCFQAYAFNRLPAPLRVPENLSSDFFGNPENRLMIRDASTGQLLPAHDSYDGFV